MSTEIKGSNNNIYWSIAEGSLRTAVPETHPEVVVRHWEAGGKKGVKYERVARAMVGKIAGVNFFDGESEGRKFTNLNIVMDANAEGRTPIISIGLSSRYAQDILKKLPNVDFEEEVQIRPYSFKPEGEDKNVTGVEIMQRDGTGMFNKKVNSFFHKKEGEKWVATNGFPVPEGDTAMYTSDDWDIFYKQTRRFLVNYTKENIAPRFGQAEISLSEWQEAADTEETTSDGAPMPTF